MKRPKLSASLVLAFALLVAAEPAHAERVYPWLDGPPARRTIAGAIPAPPGFERIRHADGSFADWLRHLPLRPEGTAVRLHDGRYKPNQLAHHAIVDLDVGPKDLQQCADAIIRLRAEYLWAAGRADDIGFHYTSGTWVAWKRWRTGWRTRVRGRKVEWVPGRAAASRDAFRAYLGAVMTFAGTASLARRMARRKAAELSAGDVLIQGGFPGHGVLVLDEARSASGEKIVLLGQSFMPAQDFHVLRNFGGGPLAPWYRASDLLTPGGLDTPEWRPFGEGDVRTFGG